MNHVQVAVHVLEDDSGKLKRERAAQDRRITQLRKQISQGSNLTDETGLSEDTLALQLNRNLDARVWNGTRFTDRAAHLSGGLGKLITNELEKSLLAQETYEAFEARMLGKLGVTDIAEPLGPLRDMDNMLRSEAKIAWNEGMLTANQAETDTVPVWRCQLRPTSTAGCVANHGQLIDELGESPLAHWGCLLPGTVVEAQALLGTRFLYAGMVKRIKTRRGNVLTVTPNHPILTSRGMVAANGIHEGDNLVTNPVAVEVKSPGFLPAEHVQNAPAFVEQVFAALALLSDGSRSVEATDHDFHGDAQRRHGDVDVVAVDRKLRDDVIGARLRYLQDFRLEARNVSLPLLARTGTSDGFDSAQLAPLGGTPRTGELLHNDCASILATHIDAPSGTLSIGHIASRDTTFSEPCAEGDAVYSSFTSKDIDGFTIQVALNEGLKFDGNPASHATDRGPVPEYDARLTQPRPESHVGNPGPFRDGQDSFSVIVRGDQGGHVHKVKAIRLGRTERLDASACELALQHASRDADFARELLECDTSLALDEVIEVQSGSYIGHVYDLQSVCGLIIANGIVTSNCYCDVITVADPDSDDESIAAAGKSYLAAMAAERDAHEQQYGDVMQEAEPSRFAFIRAPQEAETAPTLLHPAVIRSAESFAKKRSTRAAKPWGRWGGDVVDGAHAAGQATVS